MKYLIINADDFGAGRGINRGIAEAACRGVVTSTSLMVNMPGSEEAAAMRRDLPNVSVGLHLNLTNEGGPPVVDLDDEQACAAEITRQFHRFQELTGVLPTHLDAHHNVHRNPRLFPFFKNLSSDYGLPLREHSVVRYFSEFYGQWDGICHPEQISVDNLRTMLRNKIGDGYTELSCHPGYVSEDFRTAYSAEREIELKTLCDPMVREIIRECGLQLGDYRGLGKNPI